MNENIRDLLSLAEKFIAVCLIVLAVIAALSVAEGNWSNAWQCLNLAIVDYILLFILKFLFAQMVEK